MHCIIIDESQKKASFARSGRDDPLKTNVLDTILAINYYLSGPPGGHHPPLPKVRLSDDVGGVYGHGASMMSDKRLRPGSSTASEKALSIDEVLQYWRYLAQTKSDIEAQV